MSNRNNSAKKFYTIEMQLAVLDKIKRAGDIEVLLEKQDILCLFGICSRTLQTWRDTGEILYERKGKKIYYPASTLNKKIVQQSIQ
jgi:hypothetical protein